MKQRLVDAIVVYRQATGHSPDIWMVPQSKADAVADLLERATRDGRRLTDDEIANAKGARMTMLEAGITTR